MVDTAQARRARATSLSGDYAASKQPRHRDPFSILVHGLCLRLQAAWLYIHSCATVTLQQLACSCLRAAFIPRISMDQRPEAVVLQRIRKVGSTVLYTQTD